MTQPWLLRKSLLPKVPMQTMLKKRWALPFLSFLSKPPLNASQKVCRSSFRLINSWITTSKVTPTSRSSNRTSSSFRISRALLTLTRLLEILGSVRRGGCSQQPPNSLSRAKTAWRNSCALFRAMLKRFRNRVRPTITWQNSTATKSDLSRTKFWSSTKSSWSISIKHWSRILTSEL